VVSPPSTWLQNGWHFYDAIFGNGCTEAKIYNKTNKQTNKQTNKIKRVAREREIITKWIFDTYSFRPTDKHNVVLLLLSYLEYSSTFWMIRNKCNGCVFNILCSTWRFVTGDTNARNIMKCMSLGFLFFFQIEILLFVVWCSQYFSNDRWECLMDQFTV
jgi:hypothetical protein